MKIRPTVPAAIAALLFFLGGFAAAAEPPRRDTDSREAAVQRGEALFQSICRNCHSLKYGGYAARMSADDARRAFGRVPPDLSLMVKARGGDAAGGGYISALLVSFNDTPEKNSVLPNTAMPPVFSRDDPEFMRKARDVAAFLSYTADPRAGERRHLGEYVLGYLVVLTSLLFLLNRKTWKRLKKKPS